MKVQVISSFGVPPAAPFAQGEIINVTNEQARKWIKEGRVVAIADARKELPPQVPPVHNYVPRRVIRTKPTRETR